MALQEYKCYPFLAQMIQIVSQAIHEILIQSYQERYAAKIQTAIQSGIFPLPEPLIRDILWKWLLFVNQAEHISHRLKQFDSKNKSSMSPSNRVCSSPFTLTDMIVNETLVSIQLMESNEKGDHRLTQNADVCLTMARAWMFDIKTYPSVDDSDSMNPSPSIAGSWQCVEWICLDIVSGRNIHDSISPQLMACLPPYYTQLNSFVSSHFEYESPVICLTCGAIFQTIQRNGSCRLHMESCSGETGIFFSVHVSHNRLSNVVTSSSSMSLS